MELHWIREATIQLVDGYSVRDHDGREIDLVSDGWVAFDGGFAHIVVPNVAIVQVVASTAVWRVSYRRRD
ncbi:hypothetical protein [Dactylosporangium sp. CA-092794]|uniref:hypothetical protein n=1 Tax=Dactylosporangium sp. CA-092794 TaxID=3239929 RepID=UPI003D8BD9ED